jgi:predicted ATP-dependent endonuclease of OLD family
MFRVEYLKLDNHPQLGNIELFLSDFEEIHSIEKPYTSVIIGPNGTGKSFILRTISDILTQFNVFQTTGVRNINLPFHFILRYYIDDSIYEIINTRDLLQGRKPTKIYDFYKNRPFEKFEIKTVSTFEKYRIDFEKLNFPGKLIVSSILQTDRFLFKNSHPDDFYQYLGARSTSSTSSTKSSSRKTIKYLFNASASNSQFKDNLKELLSFLEFEESLKINYNTKINKLFFSGTLDERNFRRYYEEWWYEDFIYSKRKKENPLWSVPYYNNNLKENNQLLSDIVEFLNVISNKLTHKARSTSKIISIDLFDNELTDNEFEIIRHLEQLDIINLEGIKINKNNSVLSLNDVSSGEFHLIISMIGIFSKIKQNSLILIDEPEISLHPNWQMQYITFAKKVFSKYASCHFIITSHSHFIVSDLEGDSSSVTSLTRNEKTNLIDASLLHADTFGWSAEEVLYSIFNVRSSRNHFLEHDLTKLVFLINSNSNHYTEIKVVLDKLSSVSYSDADPINILIEKGYKYISEHA